jgi:iron-sulfur cluster repair protein YtfE (RIC family)
MALGLLSSRLLPPVVATASGRLRARRGGDPFQKLIQEHGVILSTLDAMERATHESLARRAGLFLTLKRTLAKHAMAEEDVIYPMLHQEARAEHESKELYSEHADIKIHMYELETMLKNNADWTQRVRDLRELIQRHARDEEEVEFPKLRALLDERRSRRVSGRIRREEALVL